MNAWTRNSPWRSTRFNQHERARVTTRTCLSFRLMGWVACGCFPQNRGKYTLYTVVSETASSTCEHKKKCGKTSCLFRRPFTNVPVVQGLSLGQRRNRRRKLVRALPEVKVLFGVLVLAIGPQKHTRASKRGVIRRFATICGEQNVTK